jgi:hypothetical protein
MTDKVETKALECIELKNAEKGEVEAVIATLGVVDHDGDIIREGAIPEGTKVTMSSYNHDTAPSLFGNGGTLPVGKGSIRIDGKKAVFDGRMFIDKSARARETFGVLQEMGSQMEWSFGFHVIGVETPSEEERKKGASRILTKLDVFEVSPVLVGAGIGTRTLAAKAADEEAAAAKAAAEAAEAERVAEEERIASERAAAELKSLATAAIEEYRRVQRTLKRMGLVA